MYTQRNLYNYIYKYISLYILLSTKKIAIKNTVIFLSSTDKMFLSVVEVEDNYISKDIDEGEE